MTGIIDGGGDAKPPVPRAARTTPGCPCDRESADILHTPPSSLPCAWPEWSDQQLVQACLFGDERAWAALVARYKTLIYSFPRRFGAGPSDAGDVFQLVCAELFVALPRLRNPDSLRSWIIAVASHQACHWKRRHVTRTRREGEHSVSGIDVMVSAPSSELERMEREQMVRDAIARLPPRCREVVRLLFYEDPPAPYQTVAERLGLAIGSIGIIRARCLKRLQGILDEVGVHQ